MLSPYTNEEYSISDLASTLENGKKRIVLRYEGMFDYYLISGNDKNCMIFKRVTYSDKNLSVLVQRIKLNNLNGEITFNEF